jgi:D-glucuronyl C5-epimerase C-terminus
MLVVVTMSRISRTLALALAASALASVPAQAGQVTLVDGRRAVRVNDPDVPSKRSVALGMPSGGATLGIASAAPAPRAARAWRRARSAARPRADRRAVNRSLDRALRSTRISAESQVRWRAQYVAAIRTYRRLRGARRDQLGYVIDSVEALALAGALSPTRMPAAFVQLDRNRRYWRSLPYPAAGDQVSFKGSEVLYQYFPGQGLQLHPLSTFKKANHMHGACERQEASCSPERLRLLLDEMEALAVQRSRRFIAWEYAFHFGGGGPPWISGMAEATGIQAYARAADQLSEPRYFEIARNALGAFETLPPRGVRTVGFAGGVHYLQYSFAPRLYIFNAFLQSLIGLHDFGRIAGDERAAKLYADAEPEAREEIPLSDVGDWSRYSYRGNESNHDYHELLRELLASMCSRRLGELYCEYADRYRGYQVDPPELTYTGPELTTAKQLTAIRFEVSKLSAVEARVYRGRKLVFSRLATFRRGVGAFAWRPRGPGLFTVQLGAKELRTGLGKKDRATTEIEVEPAA